ncbi:chloride channel protein [Mesorhizobium sp. CO1-1-7]|uniref:chloride channel protein n=1 Tax=unclassified Mesorhizobium TaxID=325217 RepID=UPI00112715D0|nr:MULTISPECIES: chloride channel protein [unclassified Mesorhizobium]MBZ9680512.1 chloride channel protein [Mesorhizobium sp. CO1-1-2]MBZ9747885.1 chloride channel protein [Mesorhizobium sp. CO1-1-7]MBZ9926338.1 chloride channel protein [Mesorhizobium sp. BR1-1-4]TPK86939.1 chloride channel protein [Mesorhizobium sp. B2-4-13]TPL72969.1 chloride channel protein [Mesorhizobium sp. B2-3-15]
MLSRNQPQVYARRLRAVLLRSVPLLEARGIAVVMLAGVIGVMAGILVTAMSQIVQDLHGLLFGVQPGGRLSGMFSLANPIQALIPAIGGILLGISVVWLRLRKFRTPVDPIEANALYGGRMSLTDTFIIVVQTMISSGFGASVGLEAGYTQVGSGVASRLARAFRLRRNDVRILVGCGAAGAISAAFDAPLTGAFYGFELVIGIYSVANVAPVMTAAISASLTAEVFGGVPFPLELSGLPQLTASQYVPFLLLGLLGGAASIAIMQLVTLIERGFNRLSVDASLRPVIGGVLVGLLGLITPQVLSSGHGALHREFAMNYGLAVVASVFVLKLAASAISLGSGFRGGLFFASLFLGALLGKSFAGVMALVSPATGIDPSVAAVVGMTSLAVGVVGGPLTMTFLALESTRDLTLTGVVLAASIMAAILVRETFGYSFSTWRFHLRGETIRSAHDVGWMRSLTVGSMMREDIKTVDASTTLAAFRKEFPLGSAQRVIAVDPGDEYVGVLIVAELHSDPSGGEVPVRDLAQYKDAVLVPSMNVQAAAETFQRAGAEELAVVEDFADHIVLGLLTEGHLMRRYAEELEKARRDLSGEG